MLKPNENIYCGFFNSDIVSGGSPSSRLRTVQFYELELFHERLGKSHIDDNTYQTERGMLLCAKPGQKRYSEFPVKCSFIRIFTEGLDESLAAILDSLPDITYIGEGGDTDDLLGLYTRLGTLFTIDSDDYCTVRINTLFYEILGNIMRLCNATPQRSEAVIPVRCVREAYEYINENYAKDCSLKTIAEAVKISPNYLHTVFTDNLGMTPLDYVTKKRIERAKQLIMIGDGSMLEIALSIGFCSQSHFSKVFREQTGFTPLAYRKMLLRQY